MHRIRRHGRLLVALLALVLVFAALALWLPDALVRRIPAATGAVWTGALFYLDRRLRRSGGEAWWTSLRWGAVSCGLLTVLLLLLDVRERFGWPEAVVAVATTAAFARWVWQTAVELGRARRRKVEPPAEVLGLARRQARRSWARPPRPLGKRHATPEKWDA